MTYPLTFYVNTLPPHAAGTANGPIIRILKTHRNDKGLYEHELEHVMQWASGVLLGVLVALLLHTFESPYWLAAFIAGAAVHPVLYSLIPKYRLWAEVQAYREQAKHYDDDRKPLFASFIAIHYKLNVTPGEALSLLEG